MTPILSRAAPSFDITAASFRAAAGDVGETIAFLTGGARPDPETLAQLTGSLRSLQGFLILEAEAQRYREAIAKAVGPLPIAQAPRPTAGWQRGAL